jgi:drug/metabolite transporter (DMT)-like permease
MLREGLVTWFPKDKMRFVKVALYLLSLFSLSQSANLVRWAEASPDMIGFWRLTVAALCILPLVYRNKSLQDTWQNARARLPIIGLSASFFFLHLWTFVFAAQNTLISHCMIIFATNPLWTALGARVFFHERFTKRMLLAYTFGMTGLVLLVRQSVKFEIGLLPGDLMALLSAIFFAGFLLAGKKAREHTLNLPYSFFLYLITGLLFALSGAVRGVDFIHWPAHTWIAIAGTILLPTFLGHALFTWLMKFMNVNLMTCGKLMEPVLAALVAAYFFGETITSSAIAAFVLTATSVVILFGPALWSRGRTAVQDRLVRQRRAPPDL